MHPPVPGRYSRTQRSINNTLDRGGISKLQEVPSLCHSANCFDASTVGRITETAMLQNPDSPWNPPEPVIITPLEFELQDLEWLKRAPGPSGRYEFDYQGAVMGTGGEYKIDLLMRLAGFRGAEITILVECTHQKKPVDRHEISILAGRLRCGCPQRDVVLNWWLPDGRNFLRR
jgi:hypothetical protein